MSNIRCVIIKPPIMLILEINAAEVANACGIVSGNMPPPIKSKPPAAVIPDIAFVTDISGLCKAGVTLQTV